MRTWLKEYRILKGMTQDDVAVAINISRPYYTRIENGTRGEPLPVPTAKKLQKH
jgi:Helix-turn-helix.